MLAYGLRQVGAHHGCPKHWKGAWDRVLGWLSGLLKETARSRTLSIIEEVVEVFEVWAQQQSQKHPA
eukprot:2755656-Prorocentrum_lima.AAC.1